MQHRPSSGASTAKRLVRLIRVQSGRKIRPAGTVALLPQPLARPVAIAEIQFFWLSLARGACGTLCQSASACATDADRLCRMAGSLSVNAAAAAIAQAVRAFARSRMWAAARAPSELVAAGAFSRRARAERCLGRLRGALASVEQRLGLWRSVLARRASAPLRTGFLKRGLPRSSGSSQASPCLTRTRRPLFAELQVERGIAVVDHAFRRRDQNLRAGSHAEVGRGRELAVGEQDLFRAVTAGQGVTWADAV